MTREQRKAYTIAKVLVGALIQLEQFDGDAELVLDSSKVELQSYRRKHIQGVEGAAEAVAALTNHYQEKAE